MISGYNEITKCEGSMEELLERLELIEIFRPIIETYPYAPLAKKVIKYIARCYSLESPCVIKGGDWLRIKGDTFRSLEIPSEYYDEIVHCKSFNVLQAIKGWLDYQNEENLETYCMLNDLIIEFRMAANSDIKKSTGEIDYEQKKKCAQSVLELQVQKNEVEQKLIQNHENLKGLNEVKIVAKKRNVIGPESYAPNGKGL